MAGLSFNTTLFTEFSIEETLAILQDLGFDAIELNMETSPQFTAHVLPDVSPTRRDEIVAAIRDSGLQLSALSPKCNMTPAEPEQRQQALEYMCGSIDLAAAMGTDVVHMALGWISEGVELDTCWQWLVDQVRRCVEHARDRGVKLGVEAGVFPQIICHDTPNLQRLIELVGYDDLYINFDPSHIAAAGDDAVEVFRTFSDRIINMHAKDGKWNGSRAKFEFPALGDGDVDWKGLARAMIETHYDGYVAVEYEAHFFSKGYPNDPLGAAKQSKQFLDDVLADWLRMLDHGSVEGD